MEEWMGAMEMDRWMNRHRWVQEEMNGGKVKECKGVWVDGGMGGTAEEFKQWWVGEWKSRSRRDEWESGGIQKTDGWKEHAGVTWMELQEGNSSKGRGGMDRQLEQILDTWRDVGVIGETQGKMWVEGTRQNRCMDGWMDGVMGMDGGNGWILQGWMDAWVHREVDG